MPSRRARPVQRIAPAVRRPIDPAMEALDIRAALSSVTHSTWSGELALLELANAGEREIDPRTWPSRYFDQLGANLVGRDSPAFRTRDAGGHRAIYSDSAAWQLTAADASGRAVIGDAKAAAEALVRGNGLGVVVTLGDVTGDPAAFGRWLAAFRRASPGVLLAGSQPGAPEFRPRDVRTFLFRRAMDLERAVDDGWVIVVAPPGSPASSDARPRSHYLMDTARAMERIAI